MASIAISGHDYLLHSDKVEDMGPFDHRFLAEGDSWMDRSGITQLSLPYHLAAELGARGKSVLIINVAKSGDTMRHITEVMKGEFMWWVRQFAYDGILFSAGGNDFIDAARGPAPGQGLLRDMAGQPLPADGYACVDQTALNTLRTDYLEPNFKTLIDAIRASANNAGTPLYLNCYDTPTARNAPAATFPKKIGPWLYTAYTKNSIDPSLWPTLTAGIFLDLKKVIEGWATSNSKITAVPTTGLLTPAAPVPGSSGDWANEIHPNAGGWQKQARVWATAMGF